MDLATLKELKLFQVELDRWRWYLLNNEMVNTNLPDFIKADMSLEQMIQLVLENNKELTSEQE